jgi:hypothetical protein
MTPDHAPDPTRRPGYRMSVTITPSDVGRRVTVRRRVPEGFRDVVGELVSWSGDGVLTVRRRDGELVEFRQETMAAAKVVPPPLR